MERQWRKQSEFNYRRFWRKIFGHFAVRFQARVQEMALIVLVDDLWQSRDRKSVTILILLDHSPAFDIIDLNILLDQLSGMGV